MNPVESGHDIQTFGRRLLETGDLDPLYIALVRAELPEPQLCRFLLAYWCFYHVGVAALISEHEDAPDYWHVMLTAAENTFAPYAYMPTVIDPSFERWPRAAERRHFRGQKCVDAVLWFSSKSPEEWVRGLLVLAETSTHQTETSVMKKVQVWPLFGPWISFKVADMMERVYGANIVFSPKSILMYDEPRAALGLLARGPLSQSKDETERRAHSVLLKDGQDEGWWYEQLLVYFSNAHRAPPRGDRPVGPQELETILCKYKSMRGGHYHVGKDIAEHRQALAGWGETAERLLRHYPEEVRL